MFDKTMLRGLIALAAAVMLFAAAGAASAQGVFNMSGTNTSLLFVPVGNPGNAAAPSTGYGAVPYTYNMGEYDVTLAQYCQFLNAVAATDTYGLYNTVMTTDDPGVGTKIGISQGGGPGAYDYSVIGNGNMPVFAVSWGDAARFCNWLQNGQPTGAEGNGTTETGAYTLDGATSDAALMSVTRNAGAKYVIPSENEWYKAAYYDPTLNGGTGGYWLYPTRSNSTPSNVLSALGTNNANFCNNGTYSDPTNFLTPVGAFADSPGPYGTYDMGGDVFQWNEANVDGEYRGQRGGSWAANIYLASSDRAYNIPSEENWNVGFRVAEVPEPGSIALLVAGVVTGLLCWRRRQPPADLAPAPLRSSVRQF